MVSYRQLLVPVDFSPKSKASLSAAAGLGRQFGAAVEVLHVWEPPAFISPKMMALLADEHPERPLSELARAQLDEDMQQLLEELESDASLHVKGRLDIGNPAEAILQGVRERRADLVVMATSGREGLQRAVLGSVAEKVVRFAPCPVLVVH